jgi:hypothetical protein
MLSPHHRRQTHQSVLLEEREEQVLLAQVVLVDIGQVIEPLLDGAHVLRAVLFIGQRVYLLHQGANLGYHLAQRAVLLQEGMQRVSRGHLERLLPVQLRPQHARMGIAQLLDALWGNALLNQLHLSSEYVAVIQVGKQLLNLRLDLGLVCALM